MSNLCVPTPERHAGLVLIAVIAAGGPGRSVKPRIPHPSRQPPTTAPTPPPADQTPVRAQQPPIRTGINFVRVDAIVTDGKGSRSSISSPRSSPSPRTTSPRKSSSSPSSRSMRRAERRAADHGDPERLRRGTRGGASRCPLVRAAARRLPRSPRQRHGGPEAAAGLHRESARPGRHGRDHVSAHAGGGHSLLEKPRRHDRGHRKLRRAEVQLPATEPVRRAVRVLPGADGRAGAEPGDDGRAQGGCGALGGLREGRKSIIFVSEGFTTTLPRS